MRERQRDPEYADEGEGDGGLGGDREGTSSST